MAQLAFMPMRTIAHILQKYGADAQRTFSFFPESPDEYTLSMEMVIDMAAMLKPTSAGRLLARASGGIIRPDDVLVDETALNNLERHPLSHSNTTDANL